MRRGDKARYAIFLFRAVRWEGSVRKIVLLRGRESNIVVFHKKGGRKVSFFLLYMNFHEISGEYLAIFIIYKRDLMCYNTSCRGTHGPISVLQNKKGIAYTCSERNVNLMA